MPRVAVEASDAVRLRAASSLLADHRVSRVGLIGRTAPDAWGDRVVSIRSAVGWDFTLGVRAPGVPEVTVGEGGDVSWAGPSGLARSLGVRLGAEARLAATVVGDESADGERFAFPSPIGWLGGRSSDGIYHCPTRSPLAAVMAVSDTSTVAVVDTREFLDAALAAGGVLLAVEGHRGPVWEAADRYLRILEDLGVVAANAV
ncbi:MAG: hypothetical protein R3246_01970 [Acidimicrobiia bacterium]|nr:hypothetical protein [Acidimicrobiia bacterium]